MTTVNILIVIILILLTAFFVASEFAIVKIRATRIDQLIKKGNKNARAVKKIIKNLDGYLSATQLGITITALVLGWLGEPAAEHLFHPLLNTWGFPESMTVTVSTIVSFIVVTFLNVVLGELAPKTIAIQKAEGVALFIAKPLIWFNRIMYPFIWLMNKSSRGVIRTVGFKPATENEETHSEEELRLILSESYKGGEINQSELQYVNKVFDFDERIAKEIMVPRTEMLCLYTNYPLQQNIDMMVSKKHTRYPVVEEEKDNIVGVVNIKEILTDQVTGENKDLEQYIYPVLTVIETTKIRDLLIEMQKQQMQMAVLIDEYGGTAGIVTVEDILEEIVGEIRDEFDSDEQPMVHKINPNKTVLSGKVLIEDVNELFGLAIDDEELDTIGGWILSQNANIDLNESVKRDGYIFKVRGIEGHQIKRIEVHKIEEEPDKDR